MVMEKSGWEYYSSKTFNGTETKATLLIALIAFVLSRRSFGGNAQLKDFRSDLVPIVTKKELIKLYEAADQFAKHYLEKEPRPTLLGKLFDICMKLCVDDFEEAVTAIRSYDFSGL
jgi:hypothetical protein